MKKLICVLWVLFLFQSFAFSQDVTISLNTTQIGLNETLQLIVTVHNDKIKEYSNFPEIDGFRRGGISSSSSTNIINGKITSQQSVIQNYTPTKQGTFEIKPFTMTVNGKQVSMKATKITVGPPVQQQYYDPFADFFSFDPFFGGRSTRPQEFIDVKEDAFFAVTSSKSEVYVGEGFTLTIAFYVAVHNKAKMEFFNISEQLNNILKKVKPAQCWEENFGIEKIEPEYVLINNVQYRQYKIYQATYYPLNAQAIEIPSVELEMIKYKVAKNPSFFGQNLMEDRKTFYSQPVRIKVKELPPHPLRDLVAVGNYRLKDKISDTIAFTGKSISYKFDIQGEGNISAIREPQTFSNEAFVFYSPNTTININRSNGIVYGNKSFQYFIEPQEPGTYDLADYLMWIYFNPQQHRYDTLRPSIRTLQIRGESKRNEAIASYDIGLFSSKIPTDNRLRSRFGSSYGIWLFNAGVGILLGTTILLFWRRKKESDVS
ncbi:MAG: BatD family protein [Cytophagales bacterium]|nr:BatD family protein [Cytophagales bacterium]MDW8384147.1 BatD family protein [Flammeovirgaceae bacterium]